MKVPAVITGISTAALIVGLAAGISLGTHLGTNGDDLVMKAQYRTGLIQPAPAKPQTAATPIALKS